MPETDWLRFQDPSYLLEQVRGAVSDRKLRLAGVALARRIAPQVADPRWHRALDLAERYAEGEATAEDLEAAYQECVRAWQRLHEQDQFAPPAQAFAVAMYLTMRKHFGDECVNQVAKAAVLVVVPDERFRQRRPQQEPPRLKLLDSSGRPFDEEDDGPAARPPAAPALLDHFGRPVRQPPIAPPPPDPEQERKAERRSQSDLLRDVIGNPFQRVAVPPAWLTPAVTALAQDIYACLDFDRMPRLADALQEAGCGNTEILRHCREPSVHTRGCWVLDLLLNKDKEAEMSEAECAGRHRRAANAAVRVRPDQRAQAAPVRLRLLPPDLAPAGRDCFG